LNRNVRDDPNGTRRASAEKEKRSGRADDLRSYHLPFDEPSGTLRASPAPGRAEKPSPLIADSGAGHELDLQPATRSHLIASDAREPEILPTGARLRMQEGADLALAHESIWPQILQPQPGEIPRP